MGGLLVIFLPPFLIEFFSVSVFAIPHILLTAVTRKAVAISLTAHQKYHSIQV
jgi:hypothetical protein